MNQWYRAAAGILAAFAVHGQISNSAIYHITTVAGGGLPVNVAATQASLRPSKVAVDANGNLFVAVNYQHIVVRVDGGTQIVTLVAGNGIGGFSGDGGVATSAQLNGPEDVAVDAAGNVYIADKYNRRIRKVSANGIITTIAGTGVFGFSGDNGPGTTAQISDPEGIAVDPAGNVYIADISNHRIRKVAVSGLITTVAGSGTTVTSGDNGAATSAGLAEPRDVAVDSAGNLFIADMNGVVRKVSPAGIITTVAGNSAAGSGYSGDNGPATSAQLRLVKGVAVDTSGSLYIADSGNHRIRKVTADGIITTLAGTGTAGVGGDGGPAVAAQLNYPQGVAVDAAGNLFIADFRNLRVRKIAVTGVITTVVGNGTDGFSGDAGAATAAQLGSPDGLAVDSAGNVYVSDVENHRVRKVAATGLITTVAGTGVRGFSGDNGPAMNAQLFAPSGLALDSAGNLYIADAWNSRIRKVNPNGVITTVAGTGVEGFSGDNGPATSARLTAPTGVAVDPSGNLYIADYYNYRVRKVATNGVITTVAGNGNPTFMAADLPATSASLTPSGIAVDSAGNLYIADENSRRVLKVGTNGMLTLVAGNGTQGSIGDNGPATAAQLFNPAGVASDASGNLYIADHGLGLLRRVSSSGIITTIAGGGSAFGDNVPATAVSLLVRNLAVDMTGNIFVSDAGNRRVRRLTPVGVPCQYSVTPRALRFSAPGEWRRIYVEATGPGCSWTPSTSAPYLNLVAMGSTGHGTVDVLAAANTGTARTGIIAVAGTNVVIEQAGACPVNLSPSAVNISADGGAQTIFVSSACGWSVSQTANWIQALQFPAAIHLMVDPNFTPRSRTTTIHAGSQVLTILQAPSAKSEADRLTGLLFFQLFGRGASAQDLQQWGPGLMTNRGATAYILFTSGETAHRSRYVTSLYRGLLNRAPEQGGWLFQRNTLAALDAQGDPAGARDGLVGNFVNSAEFKLLFGTPTNAEFVRIVYRQMLGREASQGEVDWQVSMMSGPNAQVVMARNTLLTPEVIARFEGGAVALLMYHALLLREAHPAEIAAVQQSMAAGETLAQVVARVVASPEFEALYR